MVAPRRQLRRMAVLSTVVVTLTVGAFVAQPAYAVDTWTRTGLTLDPSHTGNPVNAYGWIAGGLRSFGINGYSVDAAVYDPDTRTNLRPPLPLTRSSFAADINDARVVVGSSTSADYPYLGSIWTWKVGTAQVNTFYGDNGTGDGLAGYAINNAGLVAGAADRLENFPNNPVERAMVWDTRVSHPAPQELDTLSPDGVSMALAINNSGQVVGSAADARGNTRPVLWDAGTHSVTDLGDLPGYDSGIAHDINDRGVVVGESFRRSHPTTRQAWFWDPATRKKTALPTGSDSAANAVNKYGVVVGQDRHGAVVWDACIPQPTRLEGLAAWGVNQQEKLVVSIPATPTSGPYVTRGDRWIRSGPC